MAPLLALLVLSCSGSPQQTVDPNGADPMAAPPVEQQTQQPVPGVPAPESERVTLYFAGDSGGLGTEVREMPPVTPPSRRARRIVEALIAGPRRGLERAIPGDTVVRAVHLGDDGTAFVDLDAAFSRGLARGSEDALVAVRSLVETLAANFDDVRRVKILVEGEEVRDLGGHLDLSRPLVPEGRPVGDDDGSDAGADPR